LPFLALLSAVPLLFVLRVMRYFDKGSSELATYGWQVMGTKLGDRSSEWIDEENTRQH
jgi:hypothetical protein